MNQTLSLEAFQESLYTSFINKANLESSESLRSKFLVNNRKTGAGEIKKVITDILDELSDCDSFEFSVAFITESGVQLLKETLNRLEEKGVKGKILTTDFNLFSQPKALKQLAGFKNLEIRMFRCGEGLGFHTKAYIFNYKNQSNLIIGSSNLTQNALTTNQEWNIKLVSTNEGEVVSLVKEEFNSLWSDPHTFELSEVIDQYEEEYKNKKELSKKVTRYLSQIPDKNFKLHPNKMQRTFIHNLEEIYRRGADRAMLISATGTGKTYAAAFAVRRLMEQKLAPVGSKNSECYRPVKRVLFIVHREQICLQARNSFAKVIGQDKGQTYGILSGSQKDTETTFLFSTVQTLSKDSALFSFDPKTFDFIIIDEVHRAGAKTFQKIMDYFKPRFWLGMTASPDRPDGFDIYKLFGNEIAYEIRLQDALDYDLLCPFHYYGISDLSVPGKTVEVEDFAYLARKERVRHIIEKAKIFGHSGERVKGLIFCTKKEEAHALSDAFNAQGFITQALTGEDSQEERQKAIARLVDGVGNNRLDYIFTVDIFNEGVDIPEVNQVIFLRPTESPIIFTQQLGRGLRKAENKEFVVILDFIANYDKNYLIPVALSGDNSYDKDVMRRTVTLGSKIIPGASTIEFEKVVRDRVLQSIDNARTNSVDLLRNSYTILKNKLGRIPYPVDYEPHNGIDAVKFFESQGSYYEFLVKYDGQNYKARLSELQTRMLAYLSKNFGNGKRVAEAVLIELLIEDPETNLNLYKKVMKDRWGIEVKEDLAKNVILQLSNQFNLTQGQTEQNKDILFIEPEGDGGFTIARNFSEELRSETAFAFKEQLKALIDFIYQRYEKRYSNRYKDMDLTLNEKYTYADLCRLLNWPKNINGQNIGGYKYDAATKTLPICVNYNKAEDAIAYEDKFENERYLTALSKKNRKTDSKDADVMFKRTDEYKNTKILLFVRKNKDDKEAKAFYFLGEMNAQGEPKAVRIPEQDNSDKTSPAFEVLYKLDNPVREDIYEYLTEF